MSPSRCPTAAPPPAAAASRLRQHRHHHRRGHLPLTGTLTDGQIIVKTDDTAKVQLVLDNASVTCDGSAAIYVKSADKVFLTMAEGTENTLASTGNLHSRRHTNVDGAVFAKSDLTLNGGGTLTVRAKRATASSPRTT
jgi:hypothetical protein